MSIVFIMISCALGTLIGRVAFGRWFNHVGLYTVIWGVTLTMFELRFIRYYPLEPETWLVITICWLIFLCGSITVVVWSSGIKVKGAVDNREPAPSVLDEQMKRMKWILWFLNVTTFLVAMYEIYSVSKAFGGFSNALVLGNLLYSEREGVVNVPFLGSMVFTAVMLAGNYTALKGKMSVVAVMPLLTLIAAGLSKMGRADLLMGAIIFISSYFLTAGRQNLKTSRLRPRVRRFVSLVIIIALLVGGAEAIRSLRKVNEKLIGSTKTLQKIGQMGFITPSIYLYLSSDYGVLNQYLIRGRENNVFGGNSLLPLYRWLNYLGFEIRLEPYQPRYGIPIRTNTGTYLRELHSDFGVVGLLLVPYALGVLASIYWYRLKRYGKYSDLSVLLFLYIIIGMSFFVMATRQGQLFIFLATSLVVSWILDRKEVRVVTKKL